MLAYLINFITLYNEVLRNHYITSQLSRLCIVLFQKVLNKKLCHHTNKTIMLTNTQTIIWVTANRIVFINSTLLKAQCPN